MTLSFALRSTETTLFLFGVQDGNGLRNFHSTEGVRNEGRDPPADGVTTPSLGTLSLGGDSLRWMKRKVPRKRTGRRPGVAAAAANAVVGGVDRWRHDVHFFSATGIGVDVGVATSSGPPPCTQCQSPFITCSSFVFKLDEVRLYWVRLG